MKQKHKQTTDLNFSKLRNLLNISKAASPEEIVDVVRSQKHHAITWTDVQDPKLGELQAIAKDYDLHDVQVDLVLEKGHLDQISVEKNYIFILLQFPYRLESENRIATSQFSAFMGKDFLVTIHESALSTVRTVFDAYEDTSKHNAKSPGHMLFRIIENLLQDTARLTQEIQIELDEIESNVFDDKASDAFQIGQLRQKIMRLRRTLATQKNVLVALDDGIDQFTGEHLQRYHRLNTNVTKKLWETVEEARETIEIYKDADFTTSTERTNEILAVLTLLFTLTIPATVIGTFYGMNILLPGGLESDTWSFLGEFTAFKLVVSISFISALCMYLYFKRKKWF